ncbi:MAG: histidine ammonia-lyase [Bacteroidota bacterium]
MRSYPIDGDGLTIAQVHDIANGVAGIKLTSKARKQVSLARDLVEKWVANEETVYGITTGFGEFANVRIGPSDIEQLQVNLILSHAAGAGEMLPLEVVRAMMALRVNALAKGFSGIRLETIELLVRMLNAGIIPDIPSQGSVGASGDLVQLSHLVLAMMGIGSSTVAEKKLPSSTALKNARLKPARLKAKEGLALINGTQMMTAYAALAVHQARKLCAIADVAAGLSVEALRGSDTPFDARIHALRPFHGQRAAASNLRRMMKGSEIRESHRFNDQRVQDAYSMRCIPQVHGASRDAIEYAHNVVSIEINSANDNPLIFPKDGVHLEGGNFHGQPIALAMDFLAIALSELASISERRIERLVNGSLSGLPRFLTRNGGLNSGLMIAQYTAASIVSENKVLSHPASVDSIPTSANQEDHNSMGSISAQKAWKVLKNVQTVLAIELLCAAQGMDFAKHMGGRKAMRGGTGTEAAYQHVRKHIRHLEKDRVLHEDIQTALGLVLDGSVLDRVESTIGKLE